MRKLLAVLFAILLLLSLPAWATTYFVSNAGNNASAGTSPGTAFAFAPGMAGCGGVCGGITLVAGDSVVFRMGDTWRDTLTMGSSGTAGNPIAYATYGEASAVNPLITGLDVVSGFANGGSNIWDKAAFATQPQVVIVNGVLGNKKGSRAGCVSPGDWFWVANTLSVFSTVDPSGNVQAAQRNFAINTNSRDFISVAGLQLTGTNNTPFFINSTPHIFVAGVQEKWSSVGILIRGVTASGVFNNTDAQANFTRGWQADFADNNLVFNNDSAELNVGDGFQISDGTSNVIFNGGSSTANGNASSEGNGLSILQDTATPPVVNVLINNFVAHDNLGNGLDVFSNDTEASGNSGIIVTGGQYYHNLVSTDLSSGIRFDQKTNNSVVQYVQSYNNNSGGIVFEVTAHHNAALYNQVWGNNQGMTGSNSPGCDNVYIGNVSYANVQDGIGFTGATCASTVENNILVSNGRYGYSTDGSFADVVDHNVVFGNSTANYNGISKPATDVAADPQFVNAAAHDFRLRATSPAINAGVAQIFQYRFGLSPLSVYSSTPITVDQNFFGNGTNWTIGNYVNIPTYQPMDGRIH